MKNSSETTTNQVVILGHGMELDHDNKAHLTEGGQNRADRFLKYYMDYKREFSFEDAFVVCTGGYGELSRGEARPDDKNMREGILTADYLVRNEVPHKLIEIEKESTSTLGNLVNSIDLGYIVPEDYAYRKLGLVSHPGHLKRAAMLAGKLGLERSALSLIATEQTDSRAKEFVLRSIYRTLLIGANGADELQKREQIPSKILGAVRRS